MIVAHNDAAILGGLERWLARMLSGLGDRGHEVLLLCRDRDMVKRFQELGVPGEVLHLGGQIALHDALRLAARLRSLEPAGFLISSFTKSWLAAMGGRMAGTPRIVARLGWEDYRPGKRFTYRIAFTRWIHRTVANSEAMRTSVLQGLPKLEPRRVVTLYNGVRPEGLQGSPGSLRAELDLPPGARILGVLARLAEQKRLDRLVRMVAELGPETHAVIAGVGPQGEALRGLADSLGVGERVHFLGHREDVADVLAGLDLYVVTSRSEGMSNAMLEAMSVGVPVVSTPVSGALEALEPGPSGMAPGIVVEGDVPELAGEARRLLDDPRLLEAMGRAGRERVAERFDWSRALDAWETLLTEDVYADLGPGAPGAAPGGPR